VNYNTTAGTSVLVGVNGTAASVTTALANISNGTLNGLVPGVSLINAVAAANADKAAYGIVAATANPTFDGAADSDGANGANVKDGSVNAFEAADALNAANTARGLITSTTADAAAALTTANTTLASAKALAAANGNATAAATFDSALAAQKVLTGTLTITAAKAAAVAAENAALAGADSALTANATVTTTGTVNYASLVAKYNAALGVNGTAQTTTTLDAAALKGFLDTTPTVGVSGTTAGGVPYTAAQNLTALLAAKVAVTAELAKLPTYGQSTVDAAAKVAALNASDAAVGTSTTPGTAAATSVTDYAKAALTQSAAADTVAKITVADAAVAAAKVVVDKYVALDSSIAVAKAALTTFANANTDKVTIADASLKLNGDILAATAKSDVFYFGSKLDATKDLSIGATGSTFGAGDSIVLGSGYTFNAGALSTGNSNALEVFLVKGTTGTQVVIETEAYGNSTTTVGTDGTVLASPNATVINLVGVTADHLSVANGVVSYV
jgi:hypothetical protein